jgi:hypothetical protein
MRMNPSRMKLPLILLLCLMLVACAGGNAGNSTDRRHNGLYGGIEGGFTR